MRRLLLVLIGLIACGTCLAADAPLQQNDFLGVIGDSITEQKLYSVYIEDYLLMCQPQEHVKVMQFGWGGETAPAFFNRMDNDVMRFKPSIVTTCYGMNDGEYVAPNPETQAKYREYMDKVVEAFRMNNVRVVVGSPGCVDSTTFKVRGTKPDVYNKTLAAERDIAKDIANQRHCPFADVYDAMYNTMGKAKAKFGDQYQVCGTGVHPAANGHVIMAYAFLKALGATGDIGTITLDLAAKSATATDGHQVKSFDGTTAEIESSKYPFCFLPDPQKPGDDTSPDSMRGIIQFFPFNEDLNRFMLVVKDAKGPMKVTWGNQSKQFSAEQLTKGVNLAAEFLDNPFVEPFEKVHKAVLRQQTFETPMIKNIIHDVPSFEGAVPDHLGTVQAMVDSMTKLDQTMYDSAVNLVQPVTHTIKVENSQ